MPEFLRDPTVVVGVHPFVGVISNLGVLLWSGSALICLFSWLLLRKRISDSASSTFLLASGLMTALLSLDDFFLLHEKFYPGYLGMPEQVVFAAYGGLVIAGMMRFQKCIVRSEYLILLIALSFFALSLSVDAFQADIEQTLGDWRVLLEDGFKLLGICGWFGYFARYCFVELDAVTRVNRIERCLESLGEGAGEKNNHHPGAAAGDEDSRSEADVVPVGVSRSSPNGWR